MGLAQVMRAKAMKVAVMGVGWQRGGPVGVAKEAVVGIGEGGGLGGGGGQREGCMDLDCVAGWAKRGGRGWAPRRCAMVHCERTIVGY